MACSNGLPTRRLVQLRLARSSVRLFGSSERGACASRVSVARDWRCDSCRRGKWLSRESYRTLPHTPAGRTRGGGALGLAVWSISSRRTAYEVDFAQLRAIRAFLEKRCLPSDDRTGRVHHDPQDVARNQAPSGSVVAEQPKTEAGGMNRQWKDKGAAGEPEGRGRP